MKTSRVYSSKAVVLVIGFLFAFSLLIVFSVNGAGVSASATELEVHEEKIYSKATIDDDFDGTNVIIVLDKTISGINKRHNIGFIRRNSMGSILRKPQYMLYYK